MRSDLSQRRQRQAPRLLIIVVVVAAFPAHAASATDIYRCEDGDTIVFSDFPCDETGVLHSPEGSLSVIAAPQELARIAERNAEFLAAENARRAERAEARAAAQRAEAEAQRRVAPMVRPVPVYPGAGYGFGERPTLRPRNDGRDNRRSNRLDALRDRGRATEQDRRIPISATSGRQLGSRRPDDKG